MPPVTGVPSCWQASARPRMASANCHMTAGSSGEPKFRQSETASGLAPVVGDVAVRLRQRQLGARVRVELRVAAVAVRRDGDAEAGLLVDADHARVLGLGEHRVALHEVVVLRR